MTDPLRIRPGGAEDAPAIAGFQRALAEESEGRALDAERVEAGVRGLLARPEAGFYLVADSGDRPVASLLVTPEWSDWRNGFFWWIQSVYVTPAWRGRGVYRRLHEEVRARARRRADVCGLRLYVERGNAEARRVYERLGMTETAYRLYEETLDPGPPPHADVVPDDLTPLLSADEIAERVRALGREIAARRAAEGGRPLHLVGVLDGAFVFLADLARAIGGDVTIDFLRARSYGAGTTTSGDVRLALDLEQDVAGRDVVVVEDVVDTGLTLARVLDHVRARGPRSLRVATLLDKPARRRASVRADWVGFEIPDVFVVGYGLDHAGRHRHLRGIAVLGAPPPTTA